MWDCYVGDEAMAKRGILTLKYPVECGTVVNWDDTEKVLHHTFYNELRCAPEEHPVLITECPLNPKANREKMTQIMFETFNVPCFYMATTSLLAMIASGRETGLSITFGELTTHIAPIYCGHIIPHGVKRLDLGGRTITDYLMKILTQRGYSFTTTYERAIVQDIKEKKGFISMNYEEDIRNASTYNTNYELPDGQIIEFDKERFMCTELFFKPNNIKLEGKSLPELIYESILKCDKRLQKHLSSNIVISGGSSLFPGLPERLEKELKHILPSNLPVKIIAPEERHYLTWIGGSILSSLSIFPNFVITKEEYDEYGPTIIHRKCF